MIKSISIMAAVASGLLCGLWQSPSLLAEQIHLDVGLAHPTMHTGSDLGDGQKAENHLRISLTGFDLPNEKKRLPVNVAIVIDKSGSMQGDKIEQARRAAIAAVERLHDNDIVSIVAYDTQVDVILPATKASDRERIKRQIRALQAGGNTALHAGVKQGADEIRKFLDEQRVNRVILLSDGLANVGPASPAELEQLGEALIKQGISVSTLGLGLGYNEDLMSRLALASSGNHVFIEDAENLVQVFQHEFDDVLSVVAQQIKIRVKLSDGVRPVKLLNYPAEISGQTVDIDLGQLYSNQERYFVLEIEVPLGSSGQTRPVAEVTAKYTNMLTQTQDQLSSRVEVKFSDSAELAEQSIDKEVLADCVIQIANARNREATRLRDAGQVDAARSVLLENASFLETNYQRLGLPGLRERGELNAQQADKLDAKNWAANRKLMVEEQFGDAVQQSYRGSGKKE